MRQSAFLRLRQVRYGGFWVALLLLLFSAGCTTLDKTATVPGEQPGVATQQKDQPVARVQEAAPFVDETESFFAALPRERSWSTAVHFSFNKTDLSDEAIAILDGVVKHLTMLSSIKTIELVGHTDHIEGGGNSGNMFRISDDRAQIIKNYLVRNGVADSFIQVSGMGRTQPKTARGACAGPLSRATLVCLQPDRRVEINIVGVPR
jgi:outer membrane protein OmpA-like peptidoglycan-associated protein